MKRLIWPFIFLNFFSLGLVGNMKEKLTIVVIDLVVVYPVLKNFMSKIFFNQDERAKAERKWLKCRDVRIILGNLNILGREKKKLTFLILQHEPLFQLTIFNRYKINSSLRKTSNSVKNNIKTCMIVSVLLINFCLYK